MPSPRERLGDALADRYRIDRELGAGGMATVYLAEDLKHDRKVAIKVLKPELAAVLGAERFVVEIKTTAALSHPHILPLFDSGTADGFLYYVMPFIKGETIREKLNRETQFGVDEAVRIAREVADALDYAHRNGVIHRDIKPENILLHDGRAMVMDFGIALAVSAAAGGRMTETGLSLGTPHYMSPEQATADKEITGRSDVYSLASVLYEMLAGVPPHEGGSAQQVIMRIIADTPRPVSELRKSVPPNVSAAVAKALEKLPADRFPGAREFADALTNPGFHAAQTTTRVTSAGTASRGINLPLAALAAILLAALGWQLTRPVAGTGPSTYDVALPDSAPLDLRLSATFALAPGGEFVIYRSGAGGGDLWYRSLMDATARPIEGTAGASLPAISPDGKRVAFVRRGAAGESTVEVMFVTGGAATVIARSITAGSLEWLTDGRILLSEGDGNLARLLDPGGGTSEQVPLRYCINPSPVLDRNTFLCGGGGDKYGSWRSLTDTSTVGLLRSSRRDSTLVFGADFRLIGDDYVTYVSNGGDLLAAPIDLATGTVGRAALMVSGLQRGSYTGSGSYRVSPNGTLVYASGVNEAIGHLVRADGRTLDTLPVGREAFLQFAVSPDGRRLASVVERLDGHEVRVYDLTSGEHVVWLRGPWLRQPVWSPAGNMLISSNKDSVFVGAPDAAGRPEALFTTRNTFEGYSWLPDGRLVGTLWTEFTVASARVDRRPVILDTLVRSAAIGRPSPDRRWLAYNSPDFASLWLEPFPGTGQRYPAGTGLYPQWINGSEFVSLIGTGFGRAFERVRIDASVVPPKITRSRWFGDSRLVPIQSGAFGLTPDGRVIFKQGDEVKPARFLRVIPNWVAQMKRAVAEANR